MRWHVRHSCRDHCPLALLLGKLYESRKRREGRPEKLGHDAQVYGPTRDEVAEDAGVDPRTVSRAALEALLDRALAVSSPTADHGRPFP